MDILDAQFLAAAPVHASLPAPMFAEIAFAGRSNVGKSSLIGSLVQRRKLVRTSSTPGCTRGINLYRVRFRVESQEGTLDLVDLPGYGFAKRSKVERRSWGPLIEDFLAHRAGLRGVVIIVDVRRGLEADDVDLLEFVRHVSKTPIIVATKLDKLPASKRKIELLSIKKQASAPVFGFSSTENLGRDELWKHVLRIAAIGSETAP